MKTWWVYVASGECVDAPSVEEAITILSPRYRGETLTSDNVVEEATAEAMIREGALPGLAAEPQAARYWSRPPPSGSPGYFEV